jgi:diguanylate cyclase (GGDEF)-like protein
MECKEIFERFLAAGDRIANSWNLEEGFSGCAHAAQAVLDAKSVAIILVGEDAPYLRIISSVGLSRAFINQYKPALPDNPVLQRVVLGRQTVAVEDLSAVGPEFDGLRLDARDGAILAVPIVAMHRAVGLVVAAADEPRHFTPERVDLLGLVAHMSAGCHTRCALYDERRRLAAIDPDTGLWTFEFFCHRLEEEIARSCRHRLPLALLLIDVDSFLRFKDSYGQKAADELFAAVIAVTRSTVRGIDLLGRLGLDDLLLALPQTDLPGAIIAAERSLAAIREGKFPQPDFPVTCSAGVATLHPGETDAGPLLARVQKCLYAARLTGRDVLATEAEI